MTFGHRQWVVHLSDLHLFGHPKEQATIFRSLVTALSVERRRRGTDAALICLTGDVFDSSTLPREAATSAFATLLDGIHEALGGPVPTVIVPGNHDRRRAGLFLPHDERLFDALRDALRGRAWVLGAGAPCLAEVVPHSVHGLPLWLVAYDSNHLPDGMIGAGGAMRQEDLLRAASIIDGREPTWPVLFLLHHHLIPTPITDLGPIEVSRSPGPIRWLVENGLPRLLANGDREELFMTALGAGTALSTLAAMGRPVMVLHGHKHYATCRLLSGTRPGHGDVLIVSAGSAGTAQTWSADGTDDARLWPSFNVLELEHDRVEVEQIAYGWRHVSEAVARRPMVTVLRREARWIPMPVDREDAVEPGPRLATNEAIYELVDGGDPARWDLVVSREVAFDASGPRERYVESVHGAPGAALRIDARERDLPVEIAIEEGPPSQYAVFDASPRTVAEARLIEGRQASPYGRVALMNRYQCARASLAVRSLGARASTAFASVTDLGTGLEAALPIERGPADEVRVTIEGCSPRSLLRIHWLLEDGSADLRAGAGDLQDRGEVLRVDRLHAEADAALDDHQAGQLVGA